MSRVSDREGVGIYRGQCILTAIVVDTGLPIDIGRSTYSVEVLAPGLGATGGGERMGPHLDDEAGKETGETSWAF